MSLCKYIFFLSNTQIIQLPCNISNTHGCDVYGRLILSFRPIIPTYGEAAMEKTNLPCACRRQNPDALPFFAPAWECRKLVKLKK